MLFNSLKYVIFLPIVVIVYFILPKKFRNLFLLLASLFFYACWIPKYLILILGTVLITYFTAILIDKAKSKKHKKIFLASGIIINLIILFVFKYYNFFIDNLNSLFNYLNLGFNLNNNFSIILPVGISFYTFQSIGYCVDVYRKDVKCEKNFIIYALFVTFFPQLVAGPIERSKNLIQQFYEDHRFSYENAVAGLRYILSGMFRKVVIADTSAIIVNAVYNNIHSYSGLILIVATFLFAIQIYCDFSGYSMIAIGSAKIMGFNLMENFKSPYFSKNITEFWSRWHISLSTWFKDYVYIPLGGNRKGFVRKLINLAIVFLVSGLWHGAAWTFVIWGGLHSLFRVSEELIRKIKPNSINNKILNVTKILFTFTLVCVAWVFFRANSLSDAIYVFKNSFANFDIGLLRNNLSIILGNVLTSSTFKYYIYLLLLSSLTLLFLEDIIMFKKNINIVWYYNINKFKYVLYFFQSVLIIITSLLLIASNNQTSQFIYFQF